MPCKHLQSHSQSSPCKERSLMRLHVPLSLIPSPHHNCGMHAGVGVWNKRGYIATSTRSYFDIDEEIFWFDVSMNHLLWVAVLQCISQLSNVLQKNRLKCLASNTTLLCTVMPVLITVEPSLVPRLLPYRKTGRSLGTRVSGTFNACIFSLTLPKHQASNSTYHC